MSRAELAIAVIFRIVGGAALLATAAILLPFESMNAIHRSTGLGELPDVPIVGYLARSLSLFYAILGAITVFVSTDVRRYAPFVTLLGLVYVVSGLVQLGIDLHSRMPPLWTIGEGPFTMIVGALVLWLQYVSRGEGKS
jgi:hypothetical protein